MAQLICEDCGEVLEDDVDPDGQGGSGASPDMNVDVDPDAFDHDHDHGTGGQDDDGPDPDADPDGQDGQAPGQDGGDDDAGPGGQDDGQDGQDGPDVDQLPDADPDHLDDLDARDDARDEGDMHGVDGTDDVDADMRAKYRRLQRLKEDDVDDRMRDRDDRVDDGTPINYNGLKAPADHIKDLMAERGIHEEIEDAFRQFTHKDVARPAQHGSRLEMRNFTRRMMGDWSETRVFERDQPVEVGDRAVAVAFDMSYSMVEHVGDTHRITEGKVALAALAEACAVIGDDFMASGFTTEQPQRPIGDTLTPLITGPGEGFEWAHLDTVAPTGCTPLADGIDDARRLLEESTAREKVLIVVTDADGVGMLGYDQDQYSAREDARDAVDSARQDGHTTFGIGVDDARRNMMEDVFGSDGYLMTDADDLVDDLVRIYREQMAAV